MTSLQLYKLFIQHCPLKDVKDWRPYGDDKLYIWLKGHRDVKCIKVKLMNYKKTKFKIEAVDEDEWFKIFYGEPKARQEADDVY